MLNIKALLNKQHTVLFQQTVNNSELVVKETADYRWFEFGGQIIQSLMHKKQPRQLFTPVSQSLLLFLLWKNQPLKVLNLGLGGASIERMLAPMPQLLLTSVEASQTVIDIAQQYFKLPQKVRVICEHAEHYVQQVNVTANGQFDVVICDVFVDEKSPEFLFSTDFYLHLSQITNDKAVVMINIQAESNEQLFSALFAVKQYFAYVALIEFDDYKNIVLVCSASEIPAKEVLKQKLESFPQSGAALLTQAINKIRYIPHLNH